MIQEEAIVIDGEKLRFIRDAKGLTQSELAEQSGLSDKTISKLECGTNKNPNMKTVNSIINALEVNLEEIVRIDNECL